MFNLPEVGEYPPMPPVKPPKEDIKELFNPDIFSGSGYEICGRCRLKRPEVGHNKYFPDLCQRCWNVIIDQLDKGLIVWNEEENCYKRTDK